MLRFDVYMDGEPATEIDLSGAYLFGQDGIPVRADLTGDEGQIICIKRVAGPSGLALLWQAGDAGRMLLATTRLPERDKPYNLNVELARSQMMHLAQKVEDWGFFDFPEAQSLCDEFDILRTKFVACLKTSGGSAADLADALLGDAITLGEKMALFHADTFLARRRAAGATAPRLGFGILADLPSVAAPDYQDLLRDACDFGRNNVHQNCRRQGGSPGWSINTHPVNRYDFLS
jgi:hypothetical protein